MGKKVIVIGGGAAGLMAAYHIAEKGHGVIVLEKMEKCCRKVRITGKGRCNITNTRQPEQILEKVRAGREFVSGALYSYPSQKVIDFFEKFGVETVVERGDRVFPKSGKAWDVASALERAAKSAGAEILCNAKVEYIDVTRDGKICGIEYSSKGKGRQKLICDTVVVATGGCSYSLTGSDGDGYNFAYELGHEIMPLFPSLVPLEVKSNHLKQLNRLLLKNINVKLEINGESVREEFGELEFTQFGIMGAAVLKLSRDAVSALIDKKRVSVILDIKPSLSVAKLMGRFSRELEANQNLNVQGLLRKLMPQPLVSALIDYIKIRPNMFVRELTEKQREHIISSIKSYKLEVITYRSFREAIVTAGGVSTKEVEKSTMESKIVGGLYFVGEVLDIDADTGGYNLQLAFSTAYQMAKNL
ncbi:MAG: NAD(P)/FAD-dependent oxidoreductase [Rikenellaceae bacterium]